MVQARQELAARLVERLYADGTGKPSKWWLGFQKRSNYTLSINLSGFSNAGNRRVHEQKFRFISVTANEIVYQYKCQSSLKESCFPFPLVGIFSTIPNGRHILASSLSTFATRTRTKH